nr:PREDICTED: uncharacterized protein LOC109042353 [Bemisia tabaci]
MAEAEAFSRRLVSGWRDSEQPWGEALPRGSSRGVWSRREASFWFQVTGILLAWMALIQETSASGFSNWVPLATLRFDTGDLISCKLAEKFRALGSIYAPGLEHWLLAYDARNLVDIEPNGSLSETLITVKHVDELNHYKECYKRNNPSLPTEMVKGFVDYNKGKTLYYSLLRCSCKHYTHYWATGAKGGSFGKVSFLPPSRKCIYVLEVNTPASYRETLIPAIPPKEQPQNVQQNFLTPQNSMQIPFQAAQNLQQVPHQVPHNFQQSSFQVQQSPIQVPQPILLPPQNRQNGIPLPALQYLLQQQRLANLNSNRQNQSQQLPNFVPTPSPSEEGQGPVIFPPLQNQVKDNFLPFTPQSPKDQFQQLQSLLAVVVPQVKRVLHLQDALAQWSARQNTVPWQIR